MSGIVVWLIDKLLARLAGSLHPEQAARWAEIKRRGQELNTAEAELAQKEEALRQRSVESDNRQRDLRAQIDATDRAIAADEEQLADMAEHRRRVANDLAKAKTDIANQSDHDAVRSDV